MGRSSTCSKVNMDQVAAINSYLILNDSELIDQMIMGGNNSNTLKSREQLTQEVGVLRQQFRQHLEAESPASEIGACIADNLLWLYIPPIILLFGTVGNILTFIVLCQRSMTKVSFYVYLATLAIVDELILFCGLFRHWLDRIIDKRIEDISPVLCKLSQLIGTATSFLSVWLIVTLTFERLVVIVLPLRASQIATPRRAKILTGVLAITCFLLASHFIYSVDIVPHDAANIGGDGACAFKPQLYIVNRVWAWIDASLYSYIPFIIICSINIAIRVSIHQANKYRSAMMGGGLRRSTPWNLVSSTATTQNNKSTLSAAAAVTPQRSESTRQLTVILLTVSCAFLVTTTPIVVVKFLSLTLTFSESTTRERSNFQLADTLAEFLMHVNHAMNFYLYCATGKKFREQLCQLFRCARRKDTQISIVRPNLSRVGGGAMPMAVCQPKGYNKRNHTDSDEHSVFIKSDIGDGGISGSGRDTNDTCL